MQKIKYFLPVPDADVGAAVTFAQRAYLCTHQERDFPRAKKCVPSSFVQAFPPTSADKNHKRETTIDFPRAEGQIFFTRSY